MGQSPEGAKASTHADSDAGANADVLSDSSEASDCDSDNSQPQAPSSDDDAASVVLAAGVGISKLSGTSQEIFDALRSRLDLKKMLEGVKLGRTANGSAAYLTNGKLNEADVMFLTRLLEMAPS